MPNNLWLCQFDIAVYLEEYKLSVEYLLALHSLYSLAGKKLGQLMEYFGDAEECWNNESEWQEVLQVDNQMLRHILTEKHCADPLAVYESFLKSGANFVTMDDANYPDRLRNIDNPPYLLYYKGKLPNPADTAIAIIGSRRATSYGMQAAVHISRQLAEKGTVIVSGLARGIDAAGHRGALAVGGKNIGVLGCGIDVVYPRENKELFARVAENGCIISEFPLGTTPISRNFVMRNRLVSGLADGIVVVEATKKSGTQITVNYGLEQGKEIFAVPGPIFSPLSQGTHSLIRDDNIKLVTCGDDILEEFENMRMYAANNSHQNQQVEMFADVAANFSAMEKQIWDCLVTAKHFNDIAAEIGKDAAEIAPVLTVMEVRGYVSRQDGQYYTRNNV